MSLSSNELFTFHHIGIATHSIKNTAQYYIDAGYSMSEIVYEPIQNVYITFLEKSLMPRIELLEPGSDKSPVSKIIEKSGVSPYHICYSVENIEQAITGLRKKRFLPLSQPVKSVAIDGKNICFLYNKEVGLIELVENIA
jgi:methylmalonyl-CoA/ethylmalonyl-CoA epimerase